MALKQKILPFLSNDLAEILNKVPDLMFNGFYEIRLRAKKPLIVKSGTKTNEEFFLSLKGEVINRWDKAYIVTEQSIAQSLAKMSSYSLYAFEEELRNGFITLQGGHRVGLCGKAVVDAKEIKTLKNIASMNIRISHEVFGCADKLMPQLIKNKMPLNTLIISPPRCGKTTLLRDIIRNFSNSMFNVAVVDERSEIAGCYMGIPQNDLGIRTDVLDLCPKSEGMLMLLRAMSPDLIAVDEIGKNEEIDAIADVINAGVKLICTVHGYDEADIQKREALHFLLNRKVFERIVILSGRNGAGTIEKIMDEEMRELIWKKSS